MTKREAYLIGRNTGSEIAEHNFQDFINDEFKEELETDCNEKDVHGFQCICSQIESEHFRQFSPFEFTAQDFNESHDPDGIWSEYEKGVWKGSKQTYHKLNRKQNEQRNH
jgi:hypothetical protein